MSRVSFGVTLDPAPIPEREYIVPYRQKPHRVTFTEEELSIWTAATPDEQRKARHYMHTLPKKIIAEQVSKISAYLLGPEKESIARELAAVTVKEAADQYPPRRYAEMIYIRYLGRLAEANVMKYRTSLLSSLTTKPFSHNPRLAELVVNKICDEYLIGKIYQKTFIEALGLKESIQQVIPLS